MLSWVMTASLSSCCTLELLSTAGCVQKDSSASNNTGLAATRPKVFCQGRRRTSHYISNSPINPGRRVVVLPAEAAMLEAVLPFCRACSRVPLYKTFNLRQLGLNIQLLQSFFSPLIKWMVIVAHVWSECECLCVHLLCRRVWLPKKWYSMLYKNVSSSSDSQITKISTRDADDTVTLVRI